MEGLIMMLHVSKSMFVLLVLGRKPEDKDYTFAGLEALYDHLVRGEEDTGVAMVLNPSDIIYQWSEYDSVVEAYEYECEPIDDLRRRVQSEWGEDHDVYDDDLEDEALDNLNECCEVVRVGSVGVILRVRD